MNKKLTIGVLMGGRNNEREISFNSGRTIVDHLDKHIYQVVPLLYHITGDLFILPWKFLYRGKLDDFIQRLDEAEKITWDNLKNVVDFIYLAVHGNQAEDGCIQGMLDMLSIPYSGSSRESSACAMSKYMHGKVLRSHNIQTPQTYIIYNPQKEYNNACEYAQAIGYPLIVKPCHEGSSLGVSIVHEELQLLAALEKAYMVNDNHTQAVLMQKRLVGMEFSCVVLQTKGEFEALEVTEIVGKNNQYIFDYHDKYLPGAGVKYTPARCTEEQKKNIKYTCEKVAHILNLRHIGRIDGFLTPENEVYIIDINVFPGMAPAAFTFIQAACAGMSCTQLINHVINEALSDNNIKNNNYSLYREGTIKKMIIGLLLGGDSAEREMSLESGRNIYFKLLSCNRYEIIPLFLHNNILYKINFIQLMKDSTQEIRESLRHDQQILWNDLKTHGDFVFIGLHGGKGEDGTIQAVLETLGIPYNGSSVLASSLCMNKHKTNIFLHSQGISVPKHLFLDKYNRYNNDKIMHLINEFIFPLIVKPHNDGCSAGVYIAQNKEDLTDIIDKVLHCFPGCMVEEYIDAMELTVGVLGNGNDIIVLPPSHTIKKTNILSFEEKLLPGAGENITPALLSSEEIIFIKKEIGNIYQLLQCDGYARIDCFFRYNIKHEPELVFLECNTLPSLAPATCIFHQAAEVGLQPYEFLEKIIHLGMEKHTKYYGISDTKILLENAANN